MDDPEAVVLAKLEAELQSTQPDLLPWLPMIAIALDLEAPATSEVEQLAPESRSDKLHEVVLRFLARVLVVPTIVAVEHAHLMDAASAALFEALTGELESSAWLVLVTRRDVPGGMVLRGYEHSRLELGPLPREYMQSLAASTPEASLGGWCQTPLSRPVKMTVKNRPLRAGLRPSERPPRRI